MSFIGRPTCSEEKLQGLEVVGAGCGEISVVGIAGDSHFREVWGNKKDLYNKLPVHPTFTTWANSLFSEDSSTSLREPRSSK